MAHPTIILGFDSNCSGGREQRQSCVKKLPNRIKFKSSGMVRIGCSEASQSSLDRRSHLPNFWSGWPSRQCELLVAGSHWSSGPTDLDGQLTENSEKSKVACLQNGKYVERTKEYSRKLTKKHNE